MLRRVGDFLSYRVSGGFGGGTVEVADVISGAVLLGMNPAFSQLFDFRETFQFLCAWLPT